MNVQETNKKNGCMEVRITADDKATVRAEMDKYAKAWPAAGYGTLFGSIGFKIGTDEFQVQGFRYTSCD
jgi:hypothetical protein